MGAAVTGSLGAIVGGIAGSEKDRSKQTTRRFTGAEGADEKEARELVQNQLQSLRNLISQGPGEDAVQAGQRSQQGLAALLERFAETGGMPTEAQIGRGRELAEAQFAPQREALRQTLAQRQRETARIAGQLGRSPDDPILAAKLAEIEAQGVSQIAAQQGAAASQFAQQQPFQQIQLQQAATQVRSGLATQALQNRQTLLGLGSQVQQGFRNFRLGTQDIVSQGSSGGGFKGAVTGAIAGAGAGMQMASGFTGFGGGGGGGMAAGGGGGAGAGFGPAALAPPF